MAPLLTVQDLRVQFATRKSFVTAVDDFSLSIEPGECVGLVGESGCGKTTTGLAVMRLLPNNGHIKGGLGRPRRHRPHRPVRDARCSRTGAARSR